MNVPAIAKKTFDEMQQNSEFYGIFTLVIESLKKISNKYQRVRQVHQMIDDFNQEVFDHPLVKEYSPCKMGCSACCHTQVSVTEDEAALLASKVKQGLKIDEERLRLQMNAQDSSSEWYKLKYEDRKCVFLSEQGACQVYEDRPSVCRTNAVLGDSSQCDTREGIQKTVLVKTPKADMVICALFHQSKANGTLAHMLGKALKLKT
jgi:uncharacterized protein